MSPYVIDASVAAKWFAEEEFSENAFRLADRNEKFYAPDFFLLEMDSIFSKWIGKGIVTQSISMQIRQELKRQPIEYYPFLGLIEDAFVIACETRRSVYDSLYLALAMKMEGKMVTADRKIYNSLTGTRFIKYLEWIGDL